MASHVKSLYRPVSCGLARLSSHNVVLTANRFTPPAYPTVATALLSRRHDGCGRVGLTTSCAALSPLADKYKTEKEKEEDEKKKNSGKKKIIYQALGVGVLVGAVLGYQNSQANKGKQIANESNVKEYLLAEKPPEFKVARSITSDNDRERVVCLRYIVDSFLYDLSQNQIATAFE